MVNCAVIVAGGSGSRMGSALPKQFLKLGGKTILEHCLDRFIQSGLFCNIALVLPSAYHDYWRNLCRISGLSLDSHILCAGGETRGESVRNGIREISHLHPEREVIVAIHDAVRPFVSRKFLESCLEEARQYGNSIPCLCPPESFRFMAEPDSKEVSSPPHMTETSPFHGKSYALDRTRVRSVQTPQCFRLEEISKAFLNSKNGSPTAFTDEASLMEHSGYEIHLCPGLECNIKLTRPFDLELAEFFLSKGY